MKGQGFLPPQQLQGQRCYQQGLNGLLQFPYVAIAWQVGSGPEHSVTVVTTFTDGRCGVGQRSSAQGERCSQERTALHCVDSLSRERPMGISTCGDRTDLMGSTPRASRPAL